MKSVKTIIISLMCLLIVVSLCPKSEAAYDDYTPISPAIPVNAVGSFTLYADAGLTNAIGSAVMTAPGEIRFAAVSLDEPGDYTYYLKAADDLNSESVFKVLFHVTVNGDDILTAQVFVYPAGSEEKTVITNYSISLLKVDSEKENGQYKPLSGAVFNLYRGSDVENGKVKIRDGAAAEPLIKNMTSDENGEIVLGSLQPGTYWLRETKAPEGYGRRNSLMKLSIGNDGVKLDGTEAEAVDAEGHPIPTAVGVGHRLYRITIENTKGGIMPGTGGSGTQLFYVLGAILLIAAVALAVLKKKKG